MAMHLASMVHGSGRESEVHDQHRPLHHQLHQQPQQTHQQPQQQQQQQQPLQHQPAYYPQHPQQPHQQQRRAYGPHSTAAPSPCPSHHNGPGYHYQRPPQSPPSPPVEEQKPSLPSISSLLTIANSERANSETAGHSPRSQQHPSPHLREQHNSSHQLQLQHQQQAGGARHRSPPCPPSDLRPDQASHAFGSSIVGNPKMTMPPTPPLHADPAVDGNQSPSVASTHSASPYYLGQSMNNMEPHHQRQHTAPASAVHRQPDPYQPSTSPYQNSPYAQSPYASSPGPVSSGSYYAPDAHYGNVGMYAQRPLPSAFDPHAMPIHSQLPPANGSNVWQHHHYISTSNQSAYSPSQDRYICPTCNKAFSRPSSLRIHSHSHTGEKPYKCQQPGCGKAFSVRSNMKRHERGCHASSTATATTS
ncbi:uncharacterized protein EI97DRAFT_160859 [Westerdykella ornata]|uniref:C2H2-type domain-containing protein n=1 Tax=Westerdykella ornata TaxID=318751 RepID=A0A6A6JAV0_WESOR|nr:uncharacterized protein EI97DRAFT_160859 [Westerdykella ornata]KAF2273303.1 hypothetical protein EI97DRAFT_160859 [Westerdykella ornata]